jgi:hypothetical protein
MRAAELPKAQLSRVNADPTPSSRPTSKARLRGDMPIAPKSFQKKRVLTPKTVFLFSRRPVLKGAVREAYMNLGTLERNSDFQSFTQPVSELDLPDQVFSDRALSRSEKLATLQRLDDEPPPRGRAAIRLRHVAGSPKYGDCFRQPRMTWRLPRRRTWSGAT